MIFFILFLVVPLIELTLFYKVGGEIGLLNTLALCLLTAVIGGFLFRQQGLSKLWQMQRAMDSGELPVKEIFDGVCILVAGALLMTPGFATDVMGFSLFIPPVRRFIGLQIIKSKNVHISGGSAFSGRNPFQGGYSGAFGNRPPYENKGGDAIDVEVEHVDDDNSSQNKRAQDGGHGPGGDDDARLSEHHKDEKDT